MLNKTVANLINEQVNKEFYSAYLYLSFADYYEDEGLVNDEKRTEYLEQYGIKVIRISNLDVLKNFEGVCQYIDNVVKQSLSQLR